MYRLVEFRAEVRAEVGKIGSESRLSTSYPQVIHEFITTSKSSKCKQLSISRNGVLGNNKIGRKWRDWSYLVFSKCVWISLAASEDGGYSQVDKATLDRHCGSEIPIATNLWNREKDGREKPSFQEKLGFEKRLEVWVGGQCPPYKEVLLWIATASSS